MPAGGSGGAPRSAGASTREKGGAAGEAVGERRGRRGSTLLWRLDSCCSLQLKLLWTLLFSLLFVVAVDGAMVVAVDVAAIVAVVVAVDVDLVVAVVVAAVVVAAVVLWAVFEPWFGVCGIGKLTCYSGRWRGYVG